MLKSAASFLIESLNNYKADNLMFAILHGVTATELLLKERLSRIHPNLIFHDIDAPKVSKKKTISLSALPQRLENLGVSINEQDMRLVAEFSRWRNQIVHHMPQYSEAEARAKIGLLYDFVTVFLKKELKKDIRYLIPADLFKTLKNLLKDWHVIEAEFRQKAFREGRVIEDEECPVCGVNDVVCLRENKTAYCHLCESKLWFGECGVCNSFALALYNEFDKTIYHEKCLDAVGADYYA